MVPPFLLYRPIIEDAMLFLSFWVLIRRSRVSIEVTLAMGFPGRVVCELPAILN